MFEFDDLCSVTDCLIGSTSKAVSPLASPKLKSLLNSLKYLFLGPIESLHVIITSDLDGDQEEKPIALFRENKEAIS